MGNVVGRNELSNCTCVYVGGGIFSTKKNNLSALSFFKICVYPMLVMDGDAIQTRKKIIFVRELGFGFGNVRTIYLYKFAQ